MFDQTLFDANELLALAQLDLENKHVDVALCRIKQAMSRENCPHTAHALIAKIYAQLRLFSNAQQHFETYLEQHPQASNEHFQLGMVKFESGKAQEALNDWASVLQQNPTHPPSLFYSALALLELNQNSDAKRNLSVILQSAEVDNLYFSRAKELLGEINKNAEPNPSLARNPAEVYNTEQ